MLSYVKLNRALVAQSCSPSKVSQQSMLNGALIMEMISISSEKIQSEKVLGLEMFCVKDIAENALNRLLLLLIFM